MGSRQTAAAATTTTTTTTATTATTEVVSEAQAKCCPRPQQLFRLLFTYGIDFKQLF